MERQLVQIEKRQASVETNEKTASDEDDVPIASTIAQTSETTTQDDDKHLEAVGKNCQRLWQS